MIHINPFTKFGLAAFVLLTCSTVSYAQKQPLPSTFSFGDPTTLRWILLFMVVVVLLLAFVLNSMVSNIRNKMHETNLDVKELKNYTQNLSSKQIDKLRSIKMDSNYSSRKTGKILVFLFALTSMLGYSSSCFAQDVNQPDLLSQPGILITIILLAIPVISALIFLIVKINNSTVQAKNRHNLKEAQKLAAYLETLPAQELEELVHERKEALDYRLTHQELSGTQPAHDAKGLLQIKAGAGLPIVALKKKALPRPHVDPALSKLVIWFLGCATVWLLIGTTVGEYLGIKFVAPDADQVSWLSFGRLRPVHTNMVFWGWASLAMLGLGYYIVPRVSNAKLHSIKLGWIALILINAAVVIGSLCLMGGINNGGGEYREYIWPVMLLFAVGVILTLINFIKTIANRTTREIYISNWYIVASIIFAITIVIVAYVPWYQNGLGETIIQGYYMHQGVGMWFMLFTLGIVYYFLPQQLNRPIYSYSLGILAFWTQILFYTLIGTHHFVFSSIPWWLQTVAIVGSVGMIIPVLAGTTNFIMTFKGVWYKIKDSYTLPFFLVGIIFYFTGSMQGTAEAFRSTNLIWHFTDFTVAHSHLTMYGIICFFCWAAIYALVPRITRREAPQITVGAHFWLALIGLMFYTVPLMYGSTLRGMMWIEGKPFVDSVVFMAPYWLWRAIGGSLMWLSHIFFAYNMYRMLVGVELIDVPDKALEQLENEAGLNQLTSRSL